MTDDEQKALKTIIDNYIPKEEDTDNAVSE